jgi:hypothetical protein
MGDTVGDLLHKFRNGSIQVYICTRQRAWFRALFSFDTRFIHKTAAPMTNFEFLIQASADWSEIFNPRISREKLLE